MVAEKEKHAVFHPPLDVTVGKGLRYVVPQTLHLLKDTVFSFRVEEPSKKKTLVFKVGCKVITQKTFFRVNPAEMIRLQLAKSELEGVKRLRVELI